MARPMRPGLILRLDTKSCFLRKRSIVPKIVRLAHKYNGIPEVWESERLATTLYEYKRAQVTSHIGVQSRPATDPAPVQDMWVRVVKAASQDPRARGYLALGGDELRQDVSTLIFREFTQYPDQELSGDAKEFWRLIRNAKADRQVIKSRWNRDDIVIAASGFPSNSTYDFAKQKGFRLRELSHLGLSYDLSLLDLKPPISKTRVDVDFVYPSVGAPVKDIAKFMDGQSTNLERLIQYRVESGLAPPSCRTLEDYEILHVSTNAMEGFRAALNGWHHVLYGRNSRAGSMSLQQRPKRYASPMIFSLTQLQDWRPEPLPDAKQLWKKWSKYRTHKKWAYTEAHGLLERKIQERLPGGR